MMPARLKEPIYIPRWVLLLIYTFFVILAGTTAIRGLVVLDLTTPESYTAIWATAVAGGAVVAVFATVVRVLAPVEKWAAAWIASFLGFIAVNAIATAAGAGWLFVVFVALVPAGRAIALFSGRTA